MKHPYSKSFLFKLLIFPFLCAFLIPFSIKVIPSFLQSFYKALLIPLFLVIPLFYAVGSFACLNTILFVSIYGE